MQFTLKELVTRFLKKAAPNLSQELSIYTPSKRLPVVEQKRMLSKQLADFLHIYRKDTEQMRISLSSVLDAEKRRHRARLVDEAKLQSLVYNLSEGELEQLMSAYMKSVGSEASIHLGVSSSGSSSGSPVIVKKQLDNTNDDTATTTNDPLEFNPIKSSASTATVDHGSVVSNLDDRKSFYDRKLKRRVLNGAVVRTNSTNNSSNRPPRGSSRKQREYFGDNQAGSSYAPSRSRSRSPSVSSSTRSNSKSAAARAQSSSKILKRVNSERQQQQARNATVLAAQRSIDYETLMRSIYLNSRNGNNNNNNNNGGGGGRVKSGKSTSNGSINGKRNPSTILAFRFLFI